MKLFKKWRAQATSRWALVLVGVVSVPAIYGGLLIWSNQDPINQLNNVPAVVVNDDIPASTDDDTVSLGAELVDELLTTDKPESFTWQELGMDEATAALANGDALVMLHIPASFSANVVSLGGDDPREASAAELTITTNDGANMIIGNVAGTVGTAINSALADEVRAEYLDKIYLGFNDIHDSITEAADGAKELSDGTDTASDGAAELRVGLGALSDGTLSLADGAKAASDGADQLASGAAKLGKGLAALDTNVGGIPGKTAQLDQGAQTAAAGATSLASGADTLADGAAALSDGADAALTGAKSLHGKLGDLTKGTDTVASGASSVATGLANLRDNYDALSDGQRKALIAQLAAGSQQTSQGAAATNTGAVQLEAGAAALVGDAKAGTGLATLSASSVRLKGGAANLDKAAGTLADGLGTLATGTGALNSQMPALATAVSDLADGGGQLSTAAAKLARGTDTLADATNTLADGAGDALDGATALDDGLGDLADGASELASGLQEGVDEMPSYSDAERDHLSETAAAPVQLTAERRNEVPSYGYGLAAYFGAMAIWIGAVGFYLAFDPIAKRRLAAGQSTWKVALGSIAPGIIAGLLQGGALAWVVMNWLDIQPANRAGFLLIIAASSVAFFVVNQALLAALDLPGRFLSLILLVLQVASAGGMYPVATLPGFLQVMHEWLPLGYTVTALRSTIAGGDIGLTEAAWALGVWTAIAVLVTWVTVWVKVRRRQPDEVTVVPMEGDQDDARQLRPAGVAQQA